MREVETGRPWPGLSDIGLTFGSAAPSRERPRASRRCARQRALRDAHGCGPNPRNSARRIGWLVCDQLPDAARAARAELLDAIAAADALGYYACYSADEIYHKDAWLLFAAAAQRTDRIRFGPCVAPIYMREPTYVAQMAATLDELSDGRAEVVFGIGNIAMLEQYGVEWRGRAPSPACARRTT